MNLAAPSVVLIAVCRSERGEPDTNLADGWGEETKPAEFLANLEKAASEAIGCDYLQFLAICSLGALAPISQKSTQFLIAGKNAPILLVAQPYSNPLTYFSRGA